MIVNIEGNIGAGKTTLAFLLFEKFRKMGKKVIHIEEPVKSWTDFYGTNLLENLYNDADRWGFTFQVNALLHTTECDELAVTSSRQGFLVIKERSSFSVRHIFIDHLSDRMTDAEYRILKRIVAKVKDPREIAIADRESTCPAVATDITIYLKTDPEICYDRVTKRSRPEEADSGLLDIGYLKRLHERHEDAVSKTFGPTIVADGNSFNMSDAKSVKIYGNKEESLFDVLEQFIA